MKLKVVQALTPSRSVSHSQAPAAALEGSYNGGAGADSLVFSGNNLVSGAAVDFAGGGDNVVLVSSSNLVIPRLLDSILSSSATKQSLAVKPSVPVLPDLLV